MTTESHRPTTASPSIEVELRLLMREREDRAPAKAFGRGRTWRGSRTGAKRRRAGVPSTKLTGFEL